MNSETNEQNGYIFVPEMAEYFEKKRENVSLTWIPVHCSILFREEFQNLCTPTKYIFFAIMLTCGIRATNELPFNINYLARIAGVSRRAMSKAIDELECADMLTKRERKKEREKQKATDRQKETGARVSVSSENSLKTEDEKTAENNIESAASAIVKTKQTDGAHQSQFTLEECLRYVEKCRADGDAIQNARALATNLYQTGKADAFIMAALNPVRQEEIDRERYGAPVRFTDEPCRVCFGARMADAEGKGFRACEHCRNERGKSTGREPETEEASDVEK